MHATRHTILPSPLTADPQLAGLRDHLTELFRTLEPETDRPTICPKSIGD